MSETSMGKRIAVYRPTYAPVLFAASGLALLGAIVLVAPFVSGDLHGYPVVLPITAGLAVLSRFFWKASRNRRLEIFERGLIHWQNPRIASAVIRFAEVKEVNLGSASNRTLVLTEANGPSHAFSAQWLGYEKLVHQVQAGLASARRETTEVSPS